MNESVSLLIPTDAIELERDGEPTRFADLTDGEIEELANAFYEMLISLRISEKLSD